MSWWQVIEAVLAVIGLFTVIGFASIMARGGRVAAE